MTSFEIRKVVLQKSDIDIASSLIRIGDTFERKGRLEQALNAYGAALNIVHSQLKSDDQAMQDIVKKIGMIRSYVPGIIEFSKSI